MERLRVWAIDTSIVDITYEVISLNNSNMYIIMFIFSNNIEMNRETLLTFSWYKSCQIFQLSGSKLGQFRLEECIC
jgi:trehalose utilization protein